MQFAGYLRGQALQEWKLLDSKDKTTCHNNHYNEECDKYSTVTEQKNIEST